jgi:hypothetical protein
MLTTSDELTRLMLLEVSGEQARVVLCGLPRRASDPVPRPTAHMCIAASGQGVSPRVVMDVLGHSQLSITMDLYSHVRPSALRDAAHAMDRGAERTSMIVDHCCHRCCQSWFDSDRCWGETASD